MSGTGCAARTACRNLATSGNGGRRAGRAPIITRRGALPGRVPGNAAHAKRLDGRDDRDERQQPEFRLLIEVGPYGGG
ncbi:MAG TPA: hypothetical protein VHZ03_55410 [Trebonia sp.]|nr:hypothetical protein [Trebonia sp.]